MPEAIADQLPRLSSSRARLRGHAGLLPQLSCPDALHRRNRLASATVVAAGHSGDIALVDVTQRARADAGHAREFRAASRRYPAHTGRCAEPAELLAMFARPFARLLRPQRNTLGKTAPVLCHVCPRVLASEEARVFAAALRVPADDQFGWPESCATVEINCPMRPRGERRNSPGRLAPLARPAQPILDLVSEPRRAKNSCGRLDRAVRSDWRRRRS